MILVIIPCVAVSFALTWRLFDEISLAALIFVSLTLKFLLLGLKDWLNVISEVFDVLVDVNITALVSVHHVELLSQKFFEFRCADLLRDLRVGFLPGNTVVAICVNIAPAELFVDSFLVLLGKLSLRDFVIEALLAKKLGKGLHFTIRLSSCDFFNVILP